MAMRTSTVLITYFFYYVWVYHLLTLTMTMTMTMAADPYFQARCVDEAGNFTANSVYQSNLNTIFSRLIITTTHSQAAEFNYGFYNLTTGQYPDDYINAIALCRGDRTLDECNRCLNETVSQLVPLCPLSKEAVGWSEFCMLRYANRDIYGDLETSPDSCLYNVRDVENADRFNRVLSELLSNLSSQASAAGPLLRKYAAGNSTVGPLQAVYAMVQCTPDLSEQECGDCLSIAKEGIGGCCLGKMGCRVLKPSCFLRFESVPFYN